MLSFSHTLISLPFALLLDNPLIIFLSAAIWHVLCDTLLHWNVYPQKNRPYPVALVTLDIMAGLLIAWLITQERFFTWSVVLAIAGGNAPDVLHGFWDMLSPRQKKSLPHLMQALFRFHEKSQLETNNVRAGLIAQAVLILIGIIIVSRF